MTKNELKALRDLTNEDPYILGDLTDAEIHTYMRAAAANTKLHKLFNDYKACMMGRFPWYTYKTPEAAMRAAYAEDDYDALDWFGQKFGVHYETYNDETNEEVKTPLEDYLAAIPKKYRTTKTAKKGAKNAKRRSRR